MAKTNITKTIEATVFEHFFLQKSFRCALEVDVSRGRIDFCCYDKKNEFTGIEIKVSVADFKSKNGHNFVFHKNYYATTFEIYEKVKHLIPDGIGVYIISKSHCSYMSKKNGEKTFKYEIYCKVKCKKRDMTVDVNMVKLNMVIALNSSVRRLTDGWRYDNIEIIT